jgi:hypothetical protein
MAEKNLQRNVYSRVARFFLVQHTKNGGKYTEFPQNIPNVHKVGIPNGCNRPKYTNICIPLQDPPKMTQIWIFGLKINHLATLDFGARLFGKPSKPNL